MSSAKELLKKYKEKRQTIQNVVGYIRVSTDIQAEQGASLEAQENTIRKYSEEKKYNLVAIFKDVETGKIDNRSGLQAAIKSLSPGMKILVSDQSRFSRHALFIFNIIEELKKINCSLFFINDNIDTDDEQKALIYKFRAHIDEQERKTTSERVTRVMNFKADEGTLVKKPRYGFKIEDGKLVEHPDEIRLINFIRESIDSNPEIKIKDLKASISEKVNLGEFVIRNRKKISNGFINKLIRDNYINFPFKHTKPPYGKKIITVDNKKLLIDNDDEQEIINVIRSFIKENPNITHTSIVRHLNEQLIRLPNGKPFYPGKIAAIINYYNI